MLNLEETSFIIIHELHRLLQYFSDNLQAVLKCLPMTKHPPACRPPTTMVLGTISHLGIPVNYRAT